MSKPPSLDATKVVESDPRSWRQWTESLYVKNDHVIELSAYEQLSPWDTKDWLGVSLLCGAAPTSFELDGVRFASMDSFHYSLKLPDGESRRRCAELDAMSARKLAKGHSGRTFSYGAMEIVVGSGEHRVLFARALLAKLREHSAVQEALRNTGWARLKFPSSLLEWAGGNPSVPGLVTPVVYMLERAKRWGPVGR